MTHSFDSNNIRDESLGMTGDGSSSQQPSSVMDEVMNYDLSVQADPDLKQSSETLPRRSARPKSQRQPDSKATKKAKSVRIKKPEVTNDNPPLILTTDELISAKVQEILSPIVQKLLSTIESATKSCEVDSVSSPGPPPAHAVPINDSDEISELLDAARTNDLIEDQPSTNSNKGKAPLYSLSDWEHNSGRPILGVVSTPEDTHDVYKGVLTPFDYTVAALPQLPPAKHLPQWVFLDLFQHFNGWKTASIYVIWDRLLRYEETYRCLLTSPTTTRMALAQQFLPPNVPMHDTRPQHSITLTFLLFLAGPSVTSTMAPERLKLHLQHYMPSLLAYKGGSYPDLPPLQSGMFLIDTLSIKFVPLLFQPLL